MTNTPSNVIIQTDPITHTTSVALVNTAPPMLPLKSQLEMSFDFLLMIILLVFSFKCFVLAIRLWLGDDSAYEQNRRASRSFKDVLLGRLPPGPNVKTGMAYDEKNKKWITTGRLTDEAIEKTIYQGPLFEGIMRKLGLWD